MNYQEAIVDCGFDVGDRVSWVGKPGVITGFAEAHNPKWPLIIGVDLILDMGTTRLIAYPDELKKE